MMKYCCHLLALFFWHDKNRGKLCKCIQHAASSFLLTQIYQLIGPSMLPLEGHHNHLDILSRGKHRYAPHAHLEHAFVSYFVHSPSGLVFYSQLHLQCHLARWMCTCHAPMQGIMHQSHTSRACSTATRHKHGMQHS